MKGSNLWLWKLGMLIFLAFPGLPALAKKGKSARKKTPKILPLKWQTMPLQNDQSAEFVSFLRKIQQLKSGAQKHVNVLVVGDSHMQCEDFGLGLRNYLSDSLGIPIAGRGFVFPYPLARTSHRSDMVFKPTLGWTGCRFTKDNVRCDWGISGWVAQYGGDSTRFSWTLGKDWFLPGDEISLFCPPYRAYAYRIQMFDSLENRQTLFYNPAASAYQGKVLQASQKLFFDLKQNEPNQPMAIQGFLIKPSRSGLVWGLSGTNGARIDHYLQNPDFQKHLKLIDPQLIIVSLGTNDAFFSPFQPEKIKGFLTELLARIKSASPDAAVLLVGPPDHCMNRKKPNPRTAMINQIFAETAEELDFVFWNQQMAMGGPSAIFAWRQRNWAMADLVHFSPEGYRKLSALLGRSIGRSLSRIPR